MGKIRCVRNVQLTVRLPDGTDKQEVFAFGDIHNASAIETLDDDFVNIVFANGNRLEAVNNKVFENFGTPVMPAPVETEYVANEMVEAPEDTDIPTPIPLTGTILFDDEGDDDLGDPLV